MNIIDIQKKVLPRIKELLKKEPESISSVEKSGDGWVLNCEILEKKAVPETYDLLKVFEFKLNKEGAITGFKQLRKIRRGDVA